MLRLCYRKEQHPTYQILDLSTVYCVVSDIKGGCQQGLHAKIQQRQLFLSLAR